MQYTAVCLLVKSHNLSKTGLLPSLQQWNIAQQSRFHTNLIHRLAVSKIFHSLCFLFVGDTTQDTATGFPSTSPLAVKDRLLSGPAATLTFKSTLSLGGVNTWSNTIVLEYGGGKTILRRVKSSPDTVSKTLYPVCKVSLSGPTSPRKMVYKSHWYSCCSSN